MRYLILFLLINVQLFSCSCLDLENRIFENIKEFFQKGRDIEKTLDIYFIDSPIDEAMMPYYKLGAINAYYDCAILMAKMLNPPQESQ